MDIIGQHEKLDGYKVVVAPEMYVKNDDVVERLHAFAAQGGTVVMTTRSGVKDEHNNAIMAQLPTVYRDMAGVYAEEYAPIGRDSVTVRFADGEELQAKQWCDVLHAEGAQVLAEYAGEYFAGAPAITRNAYGEGAVYYIGTVGHQALYDKLLRSVAQEAALPVIEGIPARVEITTREGNGRKVRFAFNNDDKTHSFVLDGCSIELAPFEMKVIEA